MTLFQMSIGVSVSTIGFEEFFVILELITRAASILLSQVPVITHLISLAAL